MTDWPVKTLGDITTIATGKIDVNAATEDGEYPFITCSRDVYKIDDAPFEGKEILVAGNGDLNVKYYEGRFNAYQRTYFLLSKNEDTFYPRYIFWFLENHLDVLRSGASGSTIKYIRLGDLSDALIAVPPLEEQKRIVALLDAATARVTELTTCYEQARTHADNLFTSALRDALEGNPDWPIKTLGNLLDVSIGGIWGSEAGEDDVDVFVYRSTELIKDGQLKEVLTVRRSITARQLESRKLEEGDLLLEKSGGGPKTPVGRVGLVKVLAGLSVCSNFMQLMRPRKNEVLPVYLHFFLNHFHVAGHTEDLQNNSTNIRNLKTTEYMEIEIPVPPLEEQRRIVAQLDSMRAKTSEMIAAYDAKLKAAKNLRQSVLEAAFAGEL